MRASHVLPATAIILVTLVSSARAEPTPSETLEALWKALLDDYPMTDYVGAHGDEWIREY